MTLVSLYTSGDGHAHLIHSQRQALIASALTGMRNSPSTARLNRLWLLATTHYSSIRCRAGYLSLSRIESIRRDSLLEGEFNQNDHPFTALI